MPACMLVCVCVCATGHLWRKVGITQVSFHLVFQSATILLIAGLYKHHISQHVMSYTSIFPYMFSKYAVIHVYQFHPGLDSHSTLVMN